MEGNTTTTASPTGASGTSEAGTSQTAGSEASTSASAATTQTQQANPGVSFAELLDMRTKYDTGLTQLSAREKELKAEAERLAPYRELAERLEQGKEHPDILVELLEQRTGKSFQDLTKVIASRGPTSPEAVAALAGQKKLEAQLSEMREQMDRRAVLDELRPVLSDVRHSKLLEADGVTPEQIAQGIRALRAQGRNESPASLVEKHSAYLRSKAMAMLDADPSIAEEWNKRRTSAPAPTDPAKATDPKAAPGKPPSAVPQSAQATAKSGGTLTTAERRARALAVLKGGK